MVVGVGVVGSCMAVWVSESKDTWPPPDIKSSKNSQHDSSVTTDSRNLSLAFFPGLSPLLLL